MTFRAVLRVGVRAGFELEPPGPAILGQSLISASAGLEVGVFANVAELVTNVTVSVNDDDEDCRLRVEETYQLALGARAGASVGVQGHTWGPSPETEIPIFYTTLDEGCAMKKSARTASAPSAVTTANKFKARADEEDDWTTTTLTTKVVYEGVACASQGLVYCPASLQRTSKFVTTKTLITSVPSGVRATFPENVAATVANAIPFGAGAQLLLATSGSPVSYIPPPPSSTSHDDEPDFVDQATGGVPNRIILGVSIGLGVPILIAAVAAIVYVSHCIFPNIVSLVRPEHLTFLQYHEKEETLHSCTNRKCNVVHRLRAIRDGALRLWFQYRIQVKEPGDCRSENTIDP